MVMDEKTNNSAPRPQRKMKFMPRAPPRREQKLHLPKPEKVEGHEVFDKMEQALLKQLNEASLRLKLKPELKPSQAVTQTMVSSSPSFVKSEEMVNLGFNTSYKSPGNPNCKQAFKIKVSDYLPLEIIEEIIKKLPFKSLIQLRTLSKAWKSLIDSSDFIVHHIRQHSHVQHLLLIYDDSGVFEYKHVSIVDDDTFPYQNVTLTLPPVVEMLSFYRIIGSSHGLLGLYGGYHGGDVPRVVVLWNLSIRKAVAIVVPNVGRGVYETIIGFGVCRETLDPKIVKINQIIRSSDAESISCSPRQVEVFTLSTGVWRSPHSRSNFPRKSVEIFHLQVIVDGILYWPAIDRITKEGEFWSYNLIISFDLTSEEFGEVNLPDSLAHSDRNLYISKRNKSLVVLELDEDEKALVVWMMDNGVSKSFTKLFDIFLPDALVTSVQEFRNSGEFLVQFKHGPQLIMSGDREPQLIISGDREHQLIVSGYREHQLIVSGYREHRPEVLGYLGVSGTDVTCLVYSYIETLFLVDQPDFIIYDKGNRYNVKPRGKSYTISKLLKDADEGRVEAVEETTEPFDDEFGEKVDMMEMFGSKLVKWLDEQEKVELKKKIRELHQKMRDLKEMWIEKSLQVMK